MKEYRGIKRVALLMLAASVVAGCAPQGPLGTVGAILTAPITAPVMFVSARMNGRDAFLESARRNDRPLPAVDARSKTKAGETLEQALERGMVDQGLYWQNNADASGYAAGGVTVLATGRTDDDRVCHEVLIETAMESRPTDQRVRTYCRGNRGWSAVATHPGEGARLPSTTPSGPNGSCACVWVKTPPHGSGWRVATNSLGL